MDKYMDKSLELELSSGYDLVCGTDEAGRGPLCGPVVAARLHTAARLRPALSERLEEAVRKAA